MANAHSLVDHGGGFAAFALSIAMIAAIALAIAGGRMVAKGQDRQRGLLMLGVAIVLVANVLIWAWPAPTN
jgi:ABC-type sugar transport system permease subunit